MLAQPILNDDLDEVVKPAAFLDTGAANACIDRTAETNMPRYIAPRGLRRSAHRVAVAHTFRACNRPDRRTFVARFLHARSFPYLTVCRNGRTAQSPRC